SPVPSPARLLSPLPPSARLLSPPVPSPVRVRAFVHLVLTALRPGRWSRRCAQRKQTEVSHELSPLQVDRRGGRGGAVRHDGQRCGGVHTQPARVPPWAEGGLARAAPSAGLGARSQGRVASRNGASRIAKVGERMRRSARSAMSAIAIEAPPSGGAALWQADRAPGT